MKRGMIVSLLIFACTGFIFLGCGSHGGDAGDGFITLRGNAYFPPQYAANKTPVAGFAYQVVDFQRSPSRQLVFEGTTDADGAYAVTINQSKIVAVIVTGPIRVSGLISADPTEIGKDGEIAKEFDGITDVACEAGVTAIQDGSVSPDDFGAERIRNLEIASQLIQDSVNFNDPASVSAAALQVRQLTDDGDHPPA